jgi:predicted nucleic acid-binding protein
VILVDSSVWIDFFNGCESRETDMLALLLRRRILLTGDLILAEVLQGFRQKRDMDKARRALLGLAYADMVGREVALASAMNYRLLHRRGITTRKTIDVIIATFCIRNGHRPAACRPRLRADDQTPWPADGLSRPRSRAPTGTGVGQAGGKA